MNDFGEVEIMRQAAARLEVGNVAARDERPIARAGEDEDANRRVLFGRPHSTIESLQSRKVERVQRLRPVDRDHGNCAAAFIGNEIFRHTSSL